MTAIAATEDLAIRETEANPMQSAALSGYSLPYLHPNPDTAIFI